MASSYPDSFYYRTVTDHAPRPELEGQQSADVCIVGAGLAGLSAARARGRKGGRKKVLDAKQRAHAVDLYKSRKHTAKEVCSLMGISRATLYTYIEEFSDGP